MEGLTDITIIGAGAGGVAAAVAAAERGLAVTVVERAEAGGACAHRGCLPYVVFIERARASLAAGRPPFDFASFGADIRAERGRVRQSIESEFARLGIEFVRGDARVVDGTTVLVEGDRSGGTSGPRVVKSRRIVIASGAGRNVPAFARDGGPRVVDAGDFLLATAETPASATVVGGGTAGLELADALSSLGCAVTVLERETEILPSAGTFAAGRLAAILRKKGIRLLVGATVIGMTDGKNGPEVSYRDAHSGEIGVTSSRLAIIATGGAPDGASLFDSENAARGLGIEIIDGAIAVDDRCRTGCGTVYAIGDVTGGNATAYRARAEGRLVAVDIAEDIASNVSREPDARRAAPVSPRSKIAARSQIAQCSPSFVRTSPELAWIGLDEGAAEARGIETVSGRGWAAGNLLASARGDAEGFANLVFERDGDGTAGKLVGAQILCDRASELIGELSLAMACGLDAAALASGIRAHPTYSELVDVAAERAADRGAERRDAPR